LLARALTKVVYYGRKNQFEVFVRIKVMTTRVRKLTVSIPQDLIVFADEVAREMKISRSKVVSSCLREYAQKRFVEQMEEGYTAMAEENRQFADVAVNLAQEVLPDWE